MKVKSESDIAQSSLTLLDPMDCSLPGSSVHGISQVRVLEWVAIAFSSNHRGTQITGKMELKGEALRKSTPENLVARH